MKLLYENKEQIFSTFIKIIVLTNKIKSIANIYS